MTKANQNVGFDAANPVVRGSKLSITFTVTPLVDAEVTSATYSFMDDSPVVPGAAVLFTKTTVSGITHADNPVDGVDFVVVIEKADLSSRFQDTYYHQLEIVKANGDELLVSTGDFKLTAGGPALT